MSDLQTIPTFDRLNQHFAHQSPEAILAWSYEAFAQEIVLGTGLGPSGVVLIDMVSKICPQATIFYLDTDLLFPETYALIEKLSDRYKIRFEKVTASLTLADQEARYGAALWTQNPDRCCFLRKVLPLRNYLKDKRAWVTGLRRDQSATRAGLDFFAWDAGNAVVKVTPLAHWTAREVWQYIHRHDLPYNKLHDAGYPSLGCVPCTIPVHQGQEERSGRWAGLEKTECGIHLPQAS